MGLPDEKSPLRIDPHLLVSFLDRDLIPEEMEPPISGKFGVHVLGKFELDSQLEPKTVPGTTPNKILKVPRSLLDCRIDTIPHHVAEESNHIEQRALAAGVGTDCYVKTVQFKIHVPQTAVVEGLDSSDHQ